MDSRVFEGDYMPPAILHREREINAARLFLRGRRSVLFYGPPGTGKTTVAKFFIEKFEEEEGGKAFYINCWHFSTKLAIFSLITSKLGIVLPRRGVSGEEHLEEFVNYVRKRKEGVLIVLDEMDRLKEKVLYDILRLSEAYGVDVRVIAITNVPLYLSKIDGRVRSSLATAVEFKPYKPEELREILRMRAELGLYPGSWREEAIARCVGFAAKHGDARLGITLLYNSALIAESRGEVLNASHVDEAKPFTLQTLIEKERETLDGLEKEIVEFLEEGRKSLEEILNHTHAKERTLRKALRSLEESGFIVAEFKDRKKYFRLRFKI